MGEPVCGAGASATQAVEVAVSLYNLYTPARRAESRREDVPPRARRGAGEPRATLGDTGARGVVVGARVDRGPVHVRVVEDVHAASVVHVSMCRCEVRALLPQYRCRATAAPRARSDPRAARGRVARERDLRLAPLKRSSTTSKLHILLNSIVSPHLQPAARTRREECHRRSNSVRLHTT